MKIMPCPLNGPRDIAEFLCYGEVTEMPDPRTCSDREWIEYVFYSNNTAGVVREWWYHVQTGYWFIAERDTVRDEILRAYPASELFRERVEFGAPPAGGERR